MRENTIYMRSDRYDLDMISISKPCQSRVKAVSKHRKPINPNAWNSFFRVDFFYFIC